MYKFVYFHNHDFKRLQHYKKHRKKYSGAYEIIVLWLTDK